MLFPGIRQARKDTRPSPNNTTDGRRYNESDWDTHTRSRTLLSEVMKLLYRDALSSRILRCHLQKWILNSCDDKDSNVFPHPDLISWSAWVLFFLLFPSLQGIFLVYDITSERSFQHIMKWASDVDEVSLEIFSNTWLMLPWSDQDVPFVILTLNLKTCCHQCWRKFFLL